MRKSRWILAWALLAVLGGFLGHHLEAQSGGSPTRETSIPLEITLKNALNGASTDPAPKRPMVSGAALAQARATEILKMFKEPLAVEKDRPAFFKRPASQPAPNATTPVKLPFPPISEGPAAPDVSSQPLQILSITPQGETERAPRLSISFNQPMIAVTDPTDSEAGDPLGIKLEPRPKGAWRWLGTQTVIFEAEGAELPRATEYTVTVPAGTKSISGQTLAEAKKQTFVLPRPSVTGASPSGEANELRPLVVVSFDQPVVRQGATSRTSLQADGKRVALRELSLSEADRIQAGAATRYKDARKDTLYLFTPQEPLTAGTSYTISVEAGVESQEGPRSMDQPFTSSFRTYDPLRLESYYPNKDNKASPLSPFSLSFNNTLDRQAFDPKWITVKPEIPDMKVRVNGSSISIEGAKKGRSSYKVTVSGKLKDTFEQTLGDAVTVEFFTDQAPKTLFSGFENLTVLDPTVAPSLPLYSTNVDKLRLVVHKVEPKDWVAYQTYQSNRWRRKDDPDYGKLPGQQIEKTTVSLKGEADTLSSNSIDLSKYLENSQGNIVVWLTDPSEDKENYSQRQILTWVQGTSLGLDLQVDPDQAVALVTELRDGKPVSGATVQIGGEKATTRNDGVAKVVLPADGADYAVVSAGERRAFLPKSGSYYGRSQWVKTGRPVDARWFLFDDRGLYKPGETAHVKGYVRQWTRGPQGALTSVGSAGQAVNWTLNDPRGNKVGEGQAKLSAAGTLDFVVTLPKDTNLGHHRLTLNGTGLPGGYHSLQVQEFRRPEFEVTTEVVSDKPHLLQGSAVVKASAVYLSGGNLGGSEVHWQVTTSASSYTPPGRTDYTFGFWTPWWDLGPWWNPRTGDDSGYHNFEAQSDGEGQHSLEIGFIKAWPPRPHTVTATASVADVNRQQRSGSSNLLVHPSERYVGLKSEKSFVDDKSGFSLDAIVTDIEGNMLMGVPVKTTLFEVSYDYDENGSYGEVLKEVQTVNVSSAEAPVKIELSPPRGGTYRVRAEVSDAKNRPNRTEYTLWKAGGKLPSKDKVELEALTLVPDRQEYTPGQTANILVMAPFSEGEGLVIWSRDGLVKEERFPIQNGSATLEYPLTEELLPNLHARVSVVGKAPWGKRERPAIASGHLNLAISKASRTLSVEVLPVEAKLEPGAEVELQAVVKDHQGQPVSGAEVTLWMADEAVLGLVGYQLPQLQPSFYTDRPDGFTAHHLRTAIALGAPDLAALAQEEQKAGALMKSRAMAREEGMAMPSTAPPPPPAPPMQAAPITAAEPEADAAVNEGAPKDNGGTFTVRKNFDALAVFKGALATDASGRTKVKVKLPDNLTRYRIFSVAVKGDTRFGSGDQILTARLPVMVRPSLPRFLNFGDKAKLPVVIQNQTDKPLEIEVVGQATGVAWVGPAGKKVTVPANNRVEVTFDAEADQVGMAHFRFGAVAANGRSDAATISLPVYTPATSEAFATYGSIEKDGAISQPVQRPKDIWTQFGGLQVSLSSTALSELTDAFLYLYVYPFECSEQKASRILSIAALHDVLAAFNAEGLPSPEAIKARMGEDLAFLARLQNSDGGWEYWRRDDDSIPFVSVHVAHAVVRAKLSGHKVNQNSWDRALGYLRQIEAKCQAKNYSEQTTLSLTAYAVYVRHLAGDSDVTKAKSLLSQLKGEKSLNLEALGWIWPVLSEKAKGGPEVIELKRLVMNKATETADKAQFTMAYGEGDGEYLLLHSDRRTDAVLLYGLLGDEPANALNTKLVRGLLAQRKKGRWESTQENVWVLLALQKYFRTFEKDAPDFVARVWLETQYLGEEAFKGRSNKEAQLEVPMASVPDKTSKLIVGKTGPGRLYYRVGMNYAPKSLRLPAESRGFTLERKFRGLDNASDVSQAANGDWTVKAGAKVEVELTLVVPERRYHVALVDPLAAGLEPLNPVLLGTPPVSAGGEVRESRNWWSWWRWYEHENMHDERVEAFASLLYPGVYTYKYTALATTPGEYVLPPTKAEEMYSPETFGRTATGRLIVK